MAKAKSSRKTPTSPQFEQHLLEKRLAELRFIILSAAPGDAAIPLPAKEGDDPKTVRERTSLFAFTSTQVRRMMFLLDPTSQEKYRAELEASDGGSRRGAADSG